MGWTINYRVECERGWSEDDKRKLRAHVAKWNDALSPMSGGYNVSGMVASSPFHGFTRPAPSARAAGDYVTIVQALRELETLFPETRVFVSDTGGIVQESRPGDIDLDHLHEQMLEEWGGGEEALEGDESEDLDEADAFEGDEEDAGPEEAEPQSPEAALVAPLLERARRDFEIWKRAQKKD